MCCAEGWEIPAGMTVVVVEDTPALKYLTLPPAPPVAEAELTEAQMNELTGKELENGPPIYSIYLSEPCSRQGCSALPEQVTERSRADVARRRLETSARS